MAESDGQERTEQATPKRQQEAREKGQVPRSRELNTMSAMVAAAAAFIMMGDTLLTGLTDILHKGFSLRREEVLDTQQLLARLADAMTDAVLVLAPFFLLMVMVALLAAVALGGWSFSSKAIAFKWEKLDPIKGMKRVFSWRGIVEMFKGFGKFVLVAIAAVTLLNLQFNEFIGLGAEPLPQALAHTGELITWAFLILSFSLIVVVLIDVPFQIWDHSRQLKMTMQEVKEEHKQTNGNPEVKGKIRRLQMEMAQRRMMEEVPKADVVITNPTHYAVALRYDQATGDAPVVVAKGKDVIAMKIRSIASEHDVPIMSAPPLARAIFFSTELGESIPAGLYRAVAQVLAYVYHLRQGPVYKRSGVIDMPDIPIPDEFKRDQ